MMKRLLAAVALVAIGAMGAHAQSFPNRPVTILVPLAPGGSTDTIGRIMAEGMRPHLGTVIVENSPGAGGSAGVIRTARSAPDGYIVQIGQWGTNVASGAVYDLPINLLTDLEPVALIATQPSMIIGRKDLPANNLKELIAYIKANPGKLSYGSPGLGSSGHLAGEQFKQINNLDIAHVHYRGAAPALQDLVAGHVQVMFDIVPLTKEQLAAGRVRPLAITSAKREPAVPNVPTFAELGMPGIEGGPWFGLFAPAGTPRAAIDWVNAEANNAFSSPDLKARLEGQGLTLPLGTPEAFGKHVAAETARWGEVIRKGNIKAE
jgi:tripartite-type tricarboxylate transporter receptor subunit TctC